MSNDYPTHVDLCDGKYTLIYDLENGRSECLRYGEPWRQLVGDKMVLACFDKIVELQQQRDELVATLEGARGALAYVAVGNLGKLAVSTCQHAIYRIDALAKVGADKTGEES